jgi:Neocarzinostatin family
MQVTNRRKGLVKFGAAAALALGLGLGFQLPANAAAISVTPSSGLSDGATVTVSGSGLKAGGVYHVGQCAAIRPDAYACNSANGVDVVANGSGAATTPLVVRRSFQGTAADGSTSPVDCSVVPCVVGVFDDTFDGGAVPIAFK